MSMASAELWDGDCQQVNPLAVHQPAEGHNLDSVSGRLAGVWPEPGGIHSCRQGMQLQPETVDFSTQAVSVADSCTGWQDLARLPQMKLQCVQDSAGAQP